MTGYLRIWAGATVVAAALGVAAVPARADFDLGFGLGRLVEVGSPVPYAAEPFPLEEVPPPTPVRPYTVYVPPSGDHRLALTMRSRD